MLEPIITKLAFERIDATDEADGSGDAERSICIAFFKLDGQTISIDPTLRLAGTPMVMTSVAPNSHGHLTSGNDARQANGEAAFLARETGGVATTLWPIPVPPTLRPLLKRDAIPGVIGAVAVLMKHDGIIDADLHAQRAQFSSEIHSALTNAVRQLRPMKQSLTDADVAKLQFEFEQAVMSKLKSVVGGHNIVGGILALRAGQDDHGGSTGFVFHHGDVAAGAADSAGAPIDQHWASDVDGTGDWRVFGQMSAALPTFAGVFRGNAGPRKVLLGETWQNMVARVDAEVPHGWRPTRLITSCYGTKPRYHCLLDKGAGHYRITGADALPQILSTNTVEQARGGVLVHIDPFVNGAGELRFSAVWRVGQPAAHFIPPRNWTDFITQCKVQSAAGHRLTTVRTVVVNGQRKWCGLMHAGSGAHYFLAGMSRSAFSVKLNSLHGQGARAVSLVRYVDNGQERWACAWRQGSDAASVVFTSGQVAFDKKIESFSDSGRGLVDMTPTQI